MKKLTLAGVALAALTATSAFAQPPAAPAPAAPNGPPPMRRADVERQLREQFQRLDANHDGVLTREEAAADQGQRGPGAGGERGRSDELFDRLDTNHDGMLSREEFAGMRAMFRGGGGGGWGGRGGGMFSLNGDWFDRIDVNHSGKVTLDQLLGTVLGLFDRVDTNHDGVISPAEREAFAQTMRARQRAQGQPGPQTPPPPDGQ
jgi:Ca2+-binding EF-hand superfamily protein